MDYGFAPGGTGFDVAASNYFAWRTASNHVFALDPTIESFVAELNTSAHVNRPVHDLGIGCHGHWTGFLVIRLDSASGARATFAEVARVASAGTIRIPQSVLDPRPTLVGIEIKARFRILGCEIGVAVPYLSKLRNALGDVMIVATQHLDTVSPVTFEGQQGILRALLYDFRLLSATELKTKAEVVQAFDSAQYKWYDGTAVPSMVWEEIVPVDVVAVGTSASNRWMDLKPPINGVKMTLAPSARWSHEHEPVGPFPVTPTPTELRLESERRAFMRSNLSGLAAIQPWHAFPLYAQRGYPSFDAFMDGYDWHPSNIAGTEWAGFRHVYHVNRAITTPPTSGDVFFDFVSPTGAFEHLGLPEMDNRLFTIV